MAFTLNRAQFIGNLGADPDIKVTQNGQTIVRFSVATSSDWTNKDGEKQSRTDFHNIIVMGKFAEICEQFLRKGSKVYVEGPVQNSSWDAPDGTKKYKTEIIAKTVIFLDGKKNVDQEEPMQDSSNNDF